MDSQKLFNLVQLATGLAVVIGLVLVVVELRQTQDIAKAQLTSDVFTFLLEQSTTIMGENPAKVISKACEEPTELTAEDVEILRNFYGCILDRTRRAFAIERHSGIRYGKDPEAIARVNFGLIFDTPFGRWWWQSVSRFYEPEVSDIGDTLLASATNSVCFLRVEDYRAWLDGSSLLAK